MNDTFSAVKENYTRNNDILVLCYIESSKDEK